jgi:hypothetical protein
VPTKRFSLSLNSRRAAMLDQLLGSVPFSSFLAKVNPRRLLSAPQEGGSVPAHQGRRRQQRCQACLMMRQGLKHASSDRVHSECHTARSAVMGSKEQGRRKHHNKRRTIQITCSRSRTRGSRRTNVELGCQETPTLAPLQVPPAHLSIRCPTTPPAPAASAGTSRVAGYRSSPSAYCPR